MRHYGITPAIGGMIAEAAEVCLARHHSPPSKATVDTTRNVLTVDFQWNAPSHRSRAGHLNEIDATELGACALAIAALELSESLYVVSRTATRSGADYWVHRDPNASTLEDAIRLELSGINDATSRQLQYRVTVKLQQTQNASKTLAWAGIVAFKQLRIVLRHT
jgi:hypothetical protein